LPDAAFAVVNVVRVANSGDESSIEASVAALRLDWLARTPARQFRSLGPESGGLR